MMNLENIDTTNIATAIKQMQAQWDEAVQQLEAERLKLRNEYEQEKLAIQQQLNDEMTKMNAEKKQLEEMRNRLEEERRKLNGQGANGAIGNHKRASNSMNAAATTSGIHKQRKISPAVNASGSQNLMEKWLNAPTQNGLTVNNMRPNDGSLSLSANGIADNAVNGGGTGGTDPNGNGGNVMGDDLRSGNDGGWNPVTTKAQRKGNRRAGGTRIAPIQLERLETDRLRALGAELIAKVNRNDIFIQKLGENKNVRIMCENENAKQIVVNHLKAGNIQFNSYNTKDTKRKSYIVRGMLGENDNDAMNMIEDAFRATGIDCEIEITKFVLT